MVTEYRYYIHMKTNGHMKTATWNLYRHNPLLNGDAYTAFYKYIRSSL